MKNKELIKNVPSSSKVLEWDAKETTSGAEQKANEAFEKAKTYADENKVQKEEGKGLSSEDFTKAEKDKLASLKNYVHPEKHTATDITTNSDARFVSDAQILEWDKKETVDGAQGKADRALADAKAYTEQEINRIDNDKIDFVELQNKEILFKANELEKFRITLPSALDKIPIASVDTVGGIKVGAGLAVTGDGILSVTGGGVADSVAWDNVIGKPERFPAMEHIHELATTELNGFMSKADKLKLNGLENYTHPEKHPAEIIIEDTSHKFVTDTQIESFNDKYTKVESNNLLKRKFDNVDISGNTLRFYADSVKKIDIEIPAADFNTMINKPETFNPPVASNKNIGGIKVGTGLSILEDGTLSANIQSLNWDQINNKPEKFTPIIATKENVGGVKIGSGLNITEDGLLSIDTSSIHTHSNLSSLDKIDESKISSWDNKETTTGSQEKASEALKAAKEYTDKKMLRTKKLVINLFNYDEQSKFYKATAIHRLNTESVFIMAFDSVTKESEILSYKIIDSNTIEVATIKQVDSVDLFVIGGEFMTSIENVIINDSAVGSDSTWSSQKIDTELKKYTEVPTQLSLLRSDVEKKVAAEDLSRSGGCTINAENITAGKLSVDMLDSNNENPIIKLFDQCAIDATKSMNTGKGDAIRLKWDDNNYIKISSNDISFYNNGKATLRVHDDSNPIISFYDSTSIDSSGGAIRVRASNYSYLAVMENDARFYIGGSAVVKINNTGIVQGIPAQANVLPSTLTKEQTTFSEFVANEFGNAIVLDENNKLAIDTTKITTPEMKELLAEEDGSYSYSGCIAVLTMALKEEIEARKKLEAKITQ